MVRPKKYEKARHTSANFYIHPSFENTWKRIQELSDSDNDPAFHTYMKSVEGEDVKSNRLQGKRGLYIRWILSSHVSQKDIEKEEKDKETEK